MTRSPAGLQTLLAAITILGMDILNLGKRVKVVGEKLLELGRQREARDMEAIETLP